MNVAIAAGTRSFRSVTFDATANVVCLIDQRLLPHRFRILRCKSYQETAEAIRQMVVRGAPAIAATAAYGLVQGVRTFVGKDRQRFLQHVRRVHRTLLEARPTAVDPAHAMAEVLAAMRPGTTVSEKQALALAAAEEFAHRSAEECRALGEQGLSLIRDGVRILTHCNAGWLACVDYGTATAPLYLAHARGIRFHVYCAETRPRSQGAALTAWELAQQGIAHTVIADTAVGWLMRSGRVDMVLVGSDRVVARTGDVTNKIGTYNLAVLAKHHGVPFYVAVPLSTLDWSLDSAAQVPIEERAPSEVLGAWGVPGSPDEGTKPVRLRARVSRVYVRVANPGSPAWNPAFDVTPAALVTGILTPRGLFKPQELWAQRETLQPGPGTPGQTEPTGSRR